MGLKSLLHCVQCHLVLLILVGFLVAGYLLRDGLAVLVGWPGSQPGVAQQPLPVDTNGGAGGMFAGPVSSAAQPEAPPTPDQGAERHRGPWTDRRAVPVTGLSVGRESPPVVGPLLTQGEFRFRPLDDSTPTDSADGERRTEMLAAARRAYWIQDIPLAIRHYQALIQAYPNDPDSFGEIGNIYFEQGEHELAGQAYYEAASLLLRRGQTTRARELVELLEKTSPGHAESLLEQLQGNR